MNLSVIIPVYNGAPTIEPLMQRLAAVLPTLAESYETILVVDGSPDNSWEVVQQLAHTYPWVRGINLMRNYGQHNAILCGVHEARYEVIVTMDDDLQHPPEEIHYLLDKLAEGWDVVYGNPRKHPHAWWRIMGSVLTKWAIGLVVGNKVLQDVQAFRGPEVMLDAMLSWSTTRFTAIEVDESPRMVGVSNYNMRKLVRLAVIILTNFSTAPLRLASIVGFFFTIIGLVGLVYVLVIYFAEGSVPGFPFLSSAVIIFGGAQLFALGIIGEYLARLFERSSGRKPYTILATTDEQVGADRK
jgi:glycosyltransferase involved in cell wall biosynthesis